MQIKVTTRHGQLSDEHQEIIREKVGRLIHHFPRLMMIEAIVDVKDDEKIVELQVSAEHTPRGEALRCRRRDERSTRRAGARGCGDDRSGSVHGYRPLGFGGAREAEGRLDDRHAGSASDRDMGAATHPHAVPELHPAAHPHAWA